MRQNCETKSRKNLTESIQKVKTQLQKNHRLITIGTNTAKIIHDFNNLLSPIAVVPVILRESLPENSPWFDCCDAIYKAIDRMHEFNRQLTKLIDGSHDNVEILDLNDILGEVLELVSHFHLKDILIETNITTSKLRIKGSSCQLFRAFLNILLNARNAVDRTEGRIRVTSVTEDLTEKDYSDTNLVEGEYAKVTFEDNGSGISEQDLSQIFEPLFTTKNTEKQEGLGLGLSIVKDIIEEHQGHINVESSIGQGTRFSVYIPIAKSSSTAFQGESRRESEN